MASIYLKQGVGPNADSRKLVDCLVSSSVIAVDHKLWTTGSRAFIYKSLPCCNTVQSQ